MLKWYRGFNAEQRSAIHCSASVNDNDSSAPSGSLMLDLDRTAVGQSLVTSISAVLAP